MLHLDAEYPSDNETDDDSNFETEENTTVSVPSEESPVAVNNQPEKPKKKPLKSELTYEVVASEWKNKKIVYFDSKIHNINERYIITHNQWLTMNAQSKIVRILAEEIDGKLVTRRNTNNYLIRWDQVEHKEQPYIEMENQKWRDDYTRLYSKQSSKKNKDAKYDVVKSKYEKGELEFHSSSHAEDDCVTISYNEIRKLKPVKVVAVKQGNELVMMKDKFDCPIRWKKQQHKDNEFMLISPKEWDRWRKRKSAKVIALRKAINVGEGHKRKEIENTSDEGEQIFKTDQSAKKTKTTQPEADQFNQMLKDQSQRIFQVTSMPSMTQETTTSTIPLPTTVNSLNVTQMNFMQNMLENKLFIWAKNETQKHKENEMKQLKREIQEGLTKIPKLNDTDKKIVGLELKSKIEELKKMEEELNHSQKPSFN